MVSVPWPCATLLPGKNEKLTKLEEEDVDDEMSVDGALMMQRRQVRGVVGALLALTAFAALLSLCMLLMNVGSLGFKISVYGPRHSELQYNLTGGGNVSAALSLYFHEATRPPHATALENFGLFVTLFPGVWMGIMETVMCACAICFAIKTIRRSQRGQNATSSCAVRFAGTLLTVLFAILALFAVSACFWSMEGLKTVNWKSSTLANIFMAMMAMSGILVVLNIIISSLFCGILCCYVPNYMPIKSSPMKTFA